MTDPVPFLEALRAELLAAAARQVDVGRPVRPRRAVAPLVTGIAAALMAVVIGLALTVTRPSVAQADVRVVVAGGRVAVTLLDLEHDPRRIEAAARRAGLDVRVTAVPVGPSLVGRFVAESGMGSLPSELLAIGEDTRAFAGFSLPEGWSGALDLTVGRPARAGEEYLAHSDAFAPGEPLACASIRGRTASQAATAMLARDLEVTFDAEQPGLPPQVGPDELRERGLEAWIVIDADALSADRVVVVLAPPGTAAPPPDRC